MLHLKKTGFLLFQIVFFACCINACQVVHVSRKFEKDGSGSIDSSVLLSDTIGQRENIVFINLSHADLKRRLSGNKKNWIHLWAPWCPHCYITITKELNYDSLRADKTLQFFLVSTSYDTASAYRWLNKGKYKGPLYILSANQYGNDEGEKIRQFIHGLHPSLPGDSIAKGIPQNLIFRYDSLVCITAITQNITREKLKFLMDSDAKQ